MDHGVARCAGPSLGFVVNFPGKKPVLTRLDEFVRSRPPLSSIPYEIQSRTSGRSGISMTLWTPFRPESPRFEQDLVETREILS
jgi:hypothetical protein